MTLSEVEILMQELGRHVRDHTQIMFGTAVDGRMGNRLSVTIISSLAGDGEIIPVQAPPKIEKARAPVPIPVRSEPVEDVIESPAEPPVVETEPMEEESPTADLIPFEQPVVDETPAPPAGIPVEPQPQAAKPEAQPRLIVPKKKPPVIKEPNSEKMPKPEKAHAKQEVLQFEPISRGRFEKSEPTIVEGQDLDVPTFLRKNIRVK
jgi:cell division protein FtsZ